MPYQFESYIMEDTHIKPIYLDNFVAKNTNIKNYRDLMLKFYMFMNSD